MAIDSVTKSFLRRDVFSVKSGSVVIETPPIDADEIDDVLAFLELIKKRITNAARAEGEERE